MSEPSVAAPANPSSGAVRPTPFNAAMTAIGKALESKASPSQPTKAPESQPAPTNQALEGEASPEVEESAAAGPAEEAGAPSETENAPEDPGQQQTEEPAPLPESLDDIAKALEVDADKLGAMRVTVKTADGTEQVTLSELMAGHLRQGDYTRKTKEIAEQRRAIEARDAQIQQTWNAKLQSLDQLTEALTAQVQRGPTEADFAKYADRDNPEYNLELYLQHKVRYDAQVKALTEARAARQAEAQRQQQELYRKAVETRAEQQRLLGNALPELRKPDSLSKFHAEMSETLQGYGYETPEINAFVSGPFDHRQVLIVADAMKWRQMQKGKTKVEKQIKALPPVVKPGAAKPRVNPADEKIKALRSRLQRGRGTKADAEVLIAQALRR